MLAVCQYVDMVCIYCGGRTQVTNSRPQKRLNQTWRRRECVNCHAVFTTEEAVNLSGSLVVRRPQAPVQPFSRDKLFVSLYRALGHRKTALEDAGALCATIIAQLADNAKASISPADIAAVAHQVLRRFDTAAAVQYAAYHHS